MRYLILSDIHGNIDALEAVLRVTRRQSYDAIVVLGDLVGYGAAPNQVLKAVRRLPGDVRAIRGNHDKVAVGIEDGSGFNVIALTAARWTQERLNAASRRYLRDLPRGPGVVDGFSFCHGSPLDEDFYVLSEGHALDVFCDCDFELCFFGHTHVACAFSYGEPGTVGVQMTVRPEELQLRDGARYFLNPGAVGQPRDRDPRAAYAVYDSATRRVKWCRVEYAIGRAQRRIIKAGLPKMLADRLARGA